MNSMFRTQKNAENPFTMVDNRMVNDDRLSFGAKGVLLYLLSKKDDWTPILVDIEKHNSRKEHYVRSAVKELIDYGYIERKRIREKGKFIGTQYTVYECPFLKENITTTRKTTCGKPRTNNTYINNIKESNSSKNEEFENHLDNNDKIGYTEEEMENEDMGRSDAKRKGDLFDLEMYQLNMSKDNPYSKIIERYPIDCRSILLTFAQLWNIEPNTVPIDKNSYWIQSINEIRNLIGEETKMVSIMKRVKLKYDASPFRIESPNSIKKLVIECKSEYDKEQEEIRLRWEEKKRQVELEKKIEADRNSDSMKQSSKQLKDFIRKMKRAKRGDDDE